MIKDFFNVFLREWKCLLKGKRLLVIMILIPILYTMFFSYMYQDKVVKDLKLAIIDPHPTQYTRDIARSFDKSEKFKLEKILKTDADLDYYIKKGDIHVALIFPENFTRDVKRGKGSEIFLAASGANMVISNNALTSAMEILGNYDAAVVVKKNLAEGSLRQEAFNKAVPLTMSLRPWYNPANSYFGFFLIGLIGAVIQQATFLGVAVAITKERKFKTLMPLIEETKHPFMIVIAKIMAYFTAGSLGAFLSFFILFNFYDMPQKGSIFLLALLTGVFLLCVSTLGIFLSIISRNCLESIQYSMLIALPAFLLSGYTWPLQAMPSYIEFLGRLFPLTYYVSNLRKIALMDVSYSIISRDINILLLMTFVFLTASLGFFYIRFSRSAKRKKYQEQIQEI